jgi:hypothetical protein
LRCLIKIDEAIRTRSAVVDEDWLVTGHYIVRVTVIFGLLPSGRMIKWLTCGFSRRNVQEFEAG